ncbi:LpqB family beta-propeller domain-containing protein [Actinoplanes subglobosus]|uniref:LpqB family beta-propeller domain-containing protein n=1 Tax=Actinoplanes subglobosus TaxID=1547892 RepID=A0ABV8J635_9ACTN
MVRRVLACTAVAALLLTGGCGIPDNSDVTVVGPGPSTGTSLGEGGLRSRITRDLTSDRRQFALNYLRAAAGEYDGTLDRVKEFMAASARDNFNPPAAPRVIRLIDEPLVDSTTDRVELSYQLLGTLGKNGLLEPSPEKVEGKYELVLGEVTGEGLYVVQAPPFLLLSDTALTEYYEERTIYFWNTDRTGLVPDIRYLLRDVPIEQEPTIILNWLIGGPAPWLQDAVEPLPDGTKLENRVPAIDNDRLQVKLSAQAVPTEGAVEAMERLRIQLQWSLRSLLPEFLDLTVGHQQLRSYSGEDFVTSNPASRLVPNPERYVIYDHTIRRLVEATRPTSDTVPGIAPDDNKDVSRAALTTSGTHLFAALVTGSGKNERLRVGSAEIGETAELKEIPGLPEGPGNPVWAITPDSNVDGAVGLVIAGGRLWRFRAQGGPALEVSSPGATGAITAITVAPDGHRVALVVGGRLYRAVLNVSGDGLALTGLQQVFSPLTSITAADFSGEGWLAVSGVQRDNDRTSIIYTSIDGALQSPVLADMGREVVTYLTSYPANPLTRRNSVGSVLYSTAPGPNAWEALSSPVQIQAKDLAGPTGEPRPELVPGAPFFLN